MRTVVTHFYNEAFLLPFWLRHHRDLFDHGILIDHHSTDGSAEIGRSLAPGWTHVLSDTQDFDAIDCDFEVMLHERTVPGWKIALTTTEFLCCPDLDGVEALAEAQQIGALCFDAVVMVDPPALVLPPIGTDRALVHQRHHGYVEREHPALLGSIPYHNRLYHRFAHGSYHPGRHITNRPTVHAPGMGMLLWFGFSPWESRFLARKIQIPARVPAADREAGRGRQHLQDLAGWEAQRAHVAGHARDLRADPGFRYAVGG